MKPDVDSRWPSRKALGILDAYPALTLDGLDALAFAFVEGEQSESGVALDKPQQVFESLRDPMANSPAAYGWGFGYWAYRKCYKAAALVFAAFLVVCAICFCIRSIIPAVLFLVISGVAFNAYYRSYVLVKVEEALSAEGGSIERAEGRLRAEGGTDPRALAVTAGVMFVLVLALVVVWGLVPAISR